ncbi:MAG: phage integrase N-terminal SAM-like domain-containing protein [Leptospiraceae bacterium]|nr:phage integrase N-terminal SAM-like domain-containing protein [Leptospiraceae bacterium]
MNNYSYNQKKDTWLKYNLEEFHEPAERENDSRIKAQDHERKKIKSYVSYVNYLAKYYKKSPDKINREEVKNYLYHLRVNKQLSANTLNVVHSAIRFFTSM